MKLEFSRPILEKNSNIRFYQNPSSGRPVFPYGHDKANSRFSQFCESAKNHNTRKEVAPVTFCYQVVSMEGSGIEPGQSQREMCEYS